MNLLPTSKPNNISFTEDDCKAVLDGDFSVKIIDTKENDALPGFIPKIKMSSWILYVGVGVVALFLLPMLLKYIKNRKTATGNNISANKKSTIYTKLGLNI